MYNIRLTRIKIKFPVSDTKNRSLIKTGNYSFFADAVNTIESVVEQVPEPIFTGPIENISVPVGKEAILSCHVQNLGNYKVSQIRLYSD